MASGFPTLMAFRALLEGGSGPRSASGRPAPRTARRRLRRSSPAGPGAVFLVEHYLADVSPQTLEALTRRLRAAAADLQGGGASVGVLGSAGLPDDEALLHFVAAPSPAEAALVCDRAGFSADRIVPVLWRAERAR